MTEKGREGWSKSSQNRLGLPQSAAATASSSASDEFAKELAEFEELLNAKK